VAIDEKSTVVSNLLVRQAEFETVILNKAPAAEMMDPMPVRARLLSAWRSTPTEPFKSFWFRIDAPYVVKESRGEKEKYLARIEEEFHFAGEHLVEVVLDVAQVGVSGTRNCIQSRCARSCMARSEAASSGACSSRT
jgi:hypothetical protein